MILIIDMDGVLCTEETTFERSLAAPLPGARAAMEMLKAQGHDLIIHTARGWAEYRMTKEWLAQHAIPYDQLLMGKPIVNHLIDDRAIQFQGWESLPSNLFGDDNSQYPGGSIDELYVRILRTATRDYLSQIAARNDILSPILEVGPMSWSGMNKGVFSRMPDTFVDSRSLFEGRGHRFIALDKDPDSEPDICCDLVDLPSKIQAGSMGSLILFSVIEHVPRIWDIPSVLRYALRSGGRAFIITPWNLRFHGPRPDCWRLSDDAYNVLFGADSGFEIEKLELIPCPGRSLSPIGLFVVVRAL
jgi:hypothetical protein